MTTSSLAPIDRNALLGYAQRRIDETVLKPLQADTTTLDAAEKKTP